MKVGNKYLAYLFDTFDLPIRFIYSQTGPVSELLNRVMFWQLYASDVVRLDDRFWEMYRFLEQNGVDIHGKVVLELGPGNSFINAYHFLMHGARKVILVDKYPRLLDNARQRRFYRQEIEFVRRQYSSHDLYFLDDRGQIREEWIEFVPKELTELGSLQADFVYSVSVLEHVRDVAANVAKMASLLPTGGLMYHHIDLRDHYNFNNPFLFYKYSDEIWEKWLSKEGISYTNRWRYNDFLHEFERNGFKVLRQDVQKFTPRSGRIAPRFRGQDDLDVGILNVILQKDA